MKTSFFRRVFITVCIIILALMVFFVRKWNEGYPDTRLKDTEITISSKELLSYLDTEKAEELKPYIDKVIEVSGVLKKVTKLKKRYSLLINNGEDETYILCEMQLNENAKIPELKLNQNVTVKGVFKGVLLDIIVLNCIIVETNSVE